MDLKSRLSIATKQLLTVGSSKMKTRAANLHGWKNSSSI